LPLAAASTGRSLLGCLAASTAGLLALDALDLPICLGASAPATQRCSPLANHEQQATLCISFDSLKIVFPLFYQMEYQWLKNSLDYQAMGLEPSTLACALAPFPHAYMAKTYNHIMLPQCASAALKTRY
jgi:hypothetical protein